MQSSSQLELHSHSSNHVMEDTLMLAVSVKIVHKVAVVTVSVADAVVEVAVYVSEAAKRTEKINAFVMGSM